MAAAVVCHKATVPKCSGETEKIYVYTVGMTCVSAVRGSNRVLPVQ
jgi:hypothetical protein